VIAVVRSYKANRHPREELVIVLLSAQAEAAIAGRDRG
jgi:hypothetical protein